MGIQTWPGSTLLGIGRNVLKTRGPLGFFNGIDAMLWAGIPYCVVMYGSYQPVKRAVEEKLRQAGCEAGAWGQVLGGSLAETLGLIVFIPGELVRMRMMNDPAHMLKRNLVAQFCTLNTLALTFENLRQGLYRNFVTAVPRIVREEGVKNLFRGFGTTLLRDVPYTALTFVIFENLRAELGRRKTEGPVSLSESMLIGIATAIVCSTVTIPIDVVKSNVMTSMAGQVSFLSIFFFSRCASR